ncbi:MAG: FAD-dependent oxidoreductase [Rhodocyclaceae bacterium]|jgi:ribulose 1,5-bisphosphate synthetase/thiazole synthase|nr:FAD-dependent oxidoreductase [Rhodocyclaceae bacterium]
METIDRRPAERLQCEVLVAGGGAAGVAAAVTAARAGLDVVLIERYGFCGGAAVAGLSGTVCGLYLAHPGARRAPEQVVHGFAEEFVDALAVRGGVTEPVRYGDTWTRVHDPFVWRETADALLAQAGIRVVYHATVIAVHMEGGERLAGVRAWTKSGLLDVLAETVIDATGDADLIEMAGLQTRIGQDGRVQNPTMIFRLQGVDVARFMRRYGPDTILGAEVESLIEREQRAGADLPRRKVFLFPTPRQDQLLCNATRIVGGDGRELVPVRWRDLSEAETRGRAQARAYAAFFRAHLEGCEEAWLVDTGVQVGVRQTRQIVGQYTLTNSDVTSARKRKDGVARSPWPIELHSGEKPQLAWNHDDFYEVPYGCFVPERGESVLAAGRCLSAEHEAMASARVTGPCFAYGQAVGLAAALSVRERIAPRAIDAVFLRDQLNRQGAGLD